MNAIKFWKMLNDESKRMVEEMLDAYAGSEGIVGRIFELYEEGASAAGLTVEEYLEEITPNEYVEINYDSFLDVNMFSQLSE